MELIHASCVGDVGRVRTLLEAGADVLASVMVGPMEGCTALMNASAVGHIDCVRLLLEAGADVLATASGRSYSLSWSDGRTALSLGSARLVVVQLLCAYGAQRAMLAPDAPANCRAWVLETSEWTSQLHHVEYLSPARVRQLLVGGADVHASDGSGDGAPTPLGLARALLARNPAHEGASLVIVAAAPWSRANHALFPAHTRARGRAAAARTTARPGGALRRR